MGKKIPVNCNLFWGDASLEKMNLRKETITRLGKKIPDRKKVKYMHEPRGTRDGSPIPISPFSSNELHALESVISGFLAFVRGTTPPSHSREVQIGILEDLRPRLANAVATGTLDHEQLIPLTLAEIQILEEACRRFIQLVNEMIPRSPERDGVIGDLQGIQRRFTTMLASHHF